MHDIAWQNISGICMTEHKWDLCGDYYTSHDILGVCFRSMVFPNITKLISSTKFQGWDYDANV